MHEPYPVILVDESAAEFPETLGTKEKFWIVHDGAFHLLKFGRDGTGEDWAEKAASELCDLLGLPHAVYHLARVRDRLCVLSPSIVPKDGRLILGNELINQVGARALDGARVYRQKEHTVSRVLAALAIYLRPKYPDQWGTFIGYLLLDAWIGNTDRHHENWGIIVHGDRRLTLAPTFDHASSMGRELTDEVREARLTTRDTRYGVKAFSEKARSALFADEKDRHPLTPTEAFLLAARANRVAGLGWLNVLAGITNEQVANVFERFPPGILSEASRDFALALLAENRKRLLGNLE